MNGTIAGVAAFVCLIIGLAGCGASRTAAGDTMPDLFAARDSGPATPAEEEFYYGSVPRSVGGSYLDGVPHGVWTIYGEDREPVVQLSFERGVCRGVWTAWDDPFFEKHGLTREVANADPAGAALRVYEERLAR